MDDKNGGTLSFQALNKTQADQARLTPNELDAYNESIPQINAISATISAQIQQMQTSGMTDPSAEQRAEGLWTQYASSNLSTDVFSAFNKVRAELLENLRAVAQK